MKKQKMPRYIDADEFMNKFVNEFWSAEISFSSVDDIIEKLVKKAGDVAPVVHAHWEKCQYGMTCSSCKGFYISTEDIYDYRYCPHCGAKMSEFKPEKLSTEELKHLTEKVIKNATEQIEKDYYLYPGIGDNK